MKKILMTLALVASIQFAFAQPGGGRPMGGPGGQGGPGGAPGMTAGAAGGSKVLAQKRAAAKAALESAIAASENPKKAEKFATWIALGKAYTDANAAMTGDAWAGASRDELALVMGGPLRAANSETVEIDGQQYTKENYNGCDFYFAGNTLAMMIPTEEVAPDALKHALEAYTKAAELDVKGSKTKDITAALAAISQSLVDVAYGNYQIKNFAKASELFELAGIASETAPYSNPDFSQYYNAGFTAFSAGDNARAKALFDKCVANGYGHTDGAVYTYLSKIADAAGDKEGALAYLENGFTKFPSSQAILIELINYYITSGTDTDKLFTLLDVAKQNEPNNASLYYVEGNIKLQLGKEEEAVAAYDKCATVDPNYEFGYYGKGIYYYNKAVDLQDAAAAELDNAKYMALAEQFEQALMSCVPAFEKAFEMTSRQDVKESAADYLKNATYRLQSKGESYKAAYEKYSSFLKGE